MNIHRASASVMLRVRAKKNNAVSSNIQGDSFLESIFDILKEFPFFFYTLAN